MLSESIPAHKLTFGILCHFGIACSYANASDKAATDVSGAFPGVVHYLSETDSLKCNAAYDSRSDVRNEFDE